MTRQPSAALRHAAQSLAQRVAATPVGERLPPVSVLAADCGVSYVTMWKALDQLRREGLLQARPRRGIVVVGQPRSFSPDRSAPAARAEASPAVRAAGQKWQVVAARFRRDLLSGFHAPAAALPSAKELMARYGVCRATLAKVLRALTDEGVLRQQRSRHFPATAPAQRARSTVLLVASGEPDGTLHLPHPRTPEYLRALEYICSVRNVALSMLPFDAARGRLHDTGTIHRFRTDLTQRGAVLGVLVWQAGIDVTDWTDVVRQFVPLGKPMALLDETGELPVPRIPGQRNRIRSYGLGFSTQAGRQMGRHLIGQGHRRIAFLSPLHRSAWSQNRLAGIRKAFADTGEHTAVREFVLEQFALPADLADQCRDVRERLERLLGGARAGDGSLYARTVTMLGEQISPVLTRQSYAKAMRPLMEMALADRSVSAWVAADDDTALPCLEFLREHRIGVPDEISVVGFDDSFESSLHKLTSYNYNGPAYMRAMLAHVLSPGCPESGGARQGSVEIEGAVVVRRTSGPARR